MLRDRDYSLFVFPTKYEYWYDWARGYYYSVEDLPRFNPTYHVPIGRFILELVVLKIWLNGAPTGADPAVDNPADPLTIVSIPVPKWIDCVSRPVVESSHGNV
jgi:hypothetical protein